MNATDEGDALLHQEMRRWLRLWLAGLMAVCLDVPLWDQAFLAPAWFSAELHRDGNFRRSGTEIRGGLMATYTQTVQAFRAELAALRARIEEIDANTIGHLNRILDRLMLADAPPTSPEPIIPPMPEPQPAPLPAEALYYRSIMDNDGRGDVAWCLRYVQSIIDGELHTSGQQGDDTAFVSQAFGTLFTYDQWVHNNAVTVSYRRSIHSELVKSGQLDGSVYPRP